MSKVSTSAIKSVMKPLPLSIADEVLLKKRTIIAVIKELKTQTQVEHSGIEVSLTSK